MGALLAVALFGLLTWLGGVLIDQAWNSWMDDELSYMQVASVIIVASLAWGIVLPLFILPVVLG